MIPAEGTPLIRVLRDERETQVELAKTGLSPAGVQAMSRRALYRTVRIDGLGIGEVNILRQEMASRGGDVGVSEDLLGWAANNGVCLLTGTLSQFDRLLSRLRGPDTGMHDLAVSVEAVLHNFDDCLPSCHPGLHLERAPLLMGILNITPDSFSDGGEHTDFESAVMHALDMVARGAALIDVGGESTRPGSRPVSESEESRRVLPVVQALARPLAGRLSVDTSKARVAADALALGAFMINDVTALRQDEEMIAVVRDAGCPLILMHMLGDPRTMQDAPDYRDVTAEVYSFFVERLNWAVDRGLKEENLLIDPGIGFGKTTAHNLALLRDLEVFRGLGRPIVLGTSRKRFLGELLDLEEPSRRDSATASTTTLAVMAGVQVLRVHEVEGNREAAKLAQAVMEARA